VKKAIWYLPSFLNRAHAIDDEVVEFTEKGGWQKIDDVFPLVLGSGLHLPSWMPSIRKYTSALKVSYFFLASRQPLTSDLLCF
jgi:hypothetical protein